MKDTQIETTFTANGVKVRHIPGTDDTAMAKTLEALWQLPEKNGSAAVRNATAKGARVVRSATKLGLPQGRTGNLRRALEVHKEAQRKKGKAVYEIRYSPKFNDRLQKPIKQPGTYGGKSPHAYYPSSLEFGFLTAKGKTEGSHFLKIGAESVSEEAKAVTAQNLWVQIEKQWSKLNG